MASVYIKNDRWYIRYKDGFGKWRDKVTTAQTKTEAKRLAGELEQKGWRQQTGLEALPSQCTLTLAQLVTWWLEAYSEGRPSHGRAKSFLGKHVLESELGRCLAPQVTAGKVEVFLQGKGAELSPKSVNNLRSFLQAVFNAARRAEVFMGANPVTEVKKRKVPRRTPDYLQTEEVPRLLRALDSRWRPLFATAIFTGLRKGELCGLTRADVNVAARLLTVRRSYDHDTTKGGHSDVIPIAEELLPFLERALDASTSELVFPREDGSMMREDVKLEEVLRRALGRAGIVTGYLHVCRKQGCEHREEASDDALRRCPTDNMKLWPKPKPRHLRFHDLRHTTASLLMGAGANPAAVQRIMRHSDPRITTEVYGHLAPGYLRSEVDRLRFGVTAGPVENQRTKGSFAAGVLLEAAERQSRTSDDADKQRSRTRIAAPVLLDGAQKQDRTSFAASLLLTAAEAPNEKAEVPWKPLESRPFLGSRGQDLNLGPSGYERGTEGVQDVAGVSKLSQPLKKKTDTPVQPTQSLATSSTKFAAGLLLENRVTGGEDRPAPCPADLDEVLTVREVAAWLKVSTATVYKLVEQGELGHVRVSNAIRVPAAGVRAYLARGAA